MSYIGDSYLGLGPQYARSDAAASYQALNSSFQAAFGKTLLVGEGYRSYARQQYLYNGWVNREPGFNKAAEPGTSKHGYAIAIDFGSRVDSYGTAEKAWMNANAPSFGWEPTGDGFSPREAWHFDYTRNYEPGDDEDMTPEQDARLKNIESLLAVESGGGIRGTVNNIKAIGNNIESILAKENGGGIRATVNAIKAKLGA